MTILNCDKCNHLEKDHCDEICHGDRFCLCIRFEAPEITIMNTIPRLIEYNIIHTRTNTPLPQPITTHDNWGGKGWEYKKKWGKSQVEMVEFLTFNCGLYEDEVRRFLRCKSASVRGRLSEIKNRPVRMAVEV